MSNNNNPVEYLPHDQALEKDYETCDGTPSGCVHPRHWVYGCGVRTVFGVCQCRHHSQPKEPVFGTGLSLVKSLRRRIVELEGQLSECEASLAGSVELVGRLQEEAERFKAAVAAPGLAHIRHQAGLEPIWLARHG